MQSDSESNGLDSNEDTFMRLKVTKKLVADERQAIKLAYADFRCDRIAIEAMTYFGNFVLTTHKPGSYSTAVRQGRSGEDSAGADIITGVRDKSDLEMLQALADGVLHMDWDVRTWDAFTYRGGGCTVAAALLSDNASGQRKMYTVYAGNSHVYLISKKLGANHYSGTHLSRIHKPNGLDEHLRYEARVGKKRPVRYRMRGTAESSVSRGIGEKERGRAAGVCSIPGVMTYTCTPGEVGWLVTITDGGDRFSIDDMARLLNDVAKAEVDNIAKYICNRASSGQPDDIGVAVVRVEQPLKPDQAIVAMACDGDGDECYVSSYVCLELPGRIEAALKGELTFPAHHQEIDGDALAKARVRRRARSGYDKVTGPVVVELKRRFEQLITTIKINGAKQLLWILDAAIARKRPLSPSHFITIRRLFDITQPKDTWLDTLLKKQPKPSSALASVPVDYRGDNKNKDKQTVWTRGHFSGVRTMPAEPLGSRKCTEEGSLNPM